jgi:hypothetical protein
MGRWARSLRWIHVAAIAILAVVALFFLVGHALDKPTVSQRLAGFTFRRTEISGSLKPVGALVALDSPSLFLEVFDGNENGNHRRRSTLVRSSNGQFDLLGTARPAQTLGRPYAITGDGRKLILRNRSGSSKLGIDWELQLGGSVDYRGSSIAPDAKQFAFSTPNSWPFFSLASADNLAVLTNGDRQLQKAELLRAAPDGKFEVLAQWGVNDRGAYAWLDERPTFVLLTHDGRILAFDPERFLMKDRTELSNLGKRLGSGSVRRFALCQDFALVHRSDTLAEVVTQDGDVAPIQIIAAISQRPDGAFRSPLSNLMWMVPGFSQEKRWEMLTNKVESEGSRAPLNVVDHDFSFMPDSPTSIALLDPMYARLVTISRHHEP